MGSYQLRGSILAQIQDIHEHRIRLPVTQLLGRALRPKGLPDSDDILNTSAAVLFAESLQQYSHERAELLPLVQGDSSTAPDVLALSTSVDRRRDERAIELLRPLVAEALRLNQLELEGLLAQGARIRADNQARLKALREEVALERTAHSKRIEAARKDRVMSCSAQLKQCATSLTALYDRAGGKRAFARPVGLPSTFPSVPARQIQIGLQAPEARPWLGEHQTRSPLRPACIPVTEWRAVLVDPELPSEDRGALVLDIAMPLVLDNPPGDVRVLVIDSDSELSALAPLCLLLRDVRALRAPATSGIASTLDEVEHALRGLRAELNERLMYSLGGHRTLEDAIGAGATSAPRFVVIVLSTPRHLSGDAASVLASLADPSKGGRAGFHLIWAAATSLVQDAGLNNTHQSFIGRFCRLSALSSELGRWQDARSGQTLDFTREPISTWSTVARSSRRYSDAVLARANVGQTFADLISAFKKLEGEGMTSSRDVLDVPVGFDAHGDAVVLRIGAGTSHHGLIVGSAGAGKSRLLQVYVLAAALLYPPAELELALIDCKGADDGFKHFADAPGLPHARVVALGADREFACATLKHYLSVMRSRHRNARADSRQPGDSRRVVIILDEYQMLFAAEDRIAEEARACIAHLVRQGRSARINLILCSQSTEGMAHLPSEILNELGVRLALRCSQRDCERLFGDALAGSAITMDQRQGLLAGGPSEQSRDPRLFVTAVIDAERDITPRVQAFCRDEGRRPVVFTGDGLANPSELRHLLQQQSALPRLVVGRSLGLEGLASIEWVPERKWNLLAVSPPRNDMADRVAASCLYSIARLRGGADVHWLSGSRRGGGAAHFLQPAIRAAGAREWPAADLPAVLRQLVTTIQQRESTARGGVERPAFLVLHQIDALEVLDERDFEADRAASNAFSEILSKGPGVGVHVLATASSMARCCEMLGAKTAHFGHRVCTRLPFDDTGDLFATDVIRNLRDERCASFSAHLPGDHVVFIPFDF
jgi:hypothetical protein